jgi:hypothetical protein
MPWRMYMLSLAKQDYCNNPLPWCSSTLIRSLYCVDDLRVMRDSARSLRWLATPLYDVRLVAGLLCFPISEPTTDSRQMQRCNNYEHATIACLSRIPYSGLRLSDYDVVYKRSTGFRKRRCIVWRYRETARR